MLAAEQAGRPYSKADANLGLRKGSLSGRTKGSVEYRVQSVRLGNPPVSLPHVQNRVDDFAEHRVEGGDRIVPPRLAHAGADAGRRPAHGQGRATG